MTFKEGGRLSEYVTVEILPQPEHRRLADARHEIGRKVFRNTFGRCKNHEQDRDRLPRAKRCLRYQMLQAEERGGALSRSARESLIKNWYNQRAGSSFEKTHEHHC